ncbi:hypothetical protein QIS99_28795 [Streptomyces sp. B-S-A8]|uniref:Uncharacterized protein n=1 Tax=Streptomyces solicavernae TaxID=3043614 RepID=A0ABT6S156_9ACTN|nr:hypothetical protein [Streptomyces sp. B-S-A8]MDI3390159.1 hypothetical protein [Streptomyces sp. B-S-A8]
MHTTARLTHSELADHVAASPLSLTPSPTVQEAAAVIAEDLLTHRRPQPLLAWEAGRFPETALARRTNSREFIEQLGVDKLVAAVEEALLSVRALTIRQPWAGAITHLGKHCENRSTRIHYRGLLLVHAAKLTAGPTLVRQVRRMDPELPLPLQAVIGTARVAGCHRARYTEQGDVCCRPWGEPGTADSLVWHWELSNVRRLPSPVHWSGKQSLWRPTAELLDAVISSEEATR